MHLSVFSDVPSESFRGNRGYNWVYAIHVVSIWWIYSLTVLIRSKMKWTFAKLLFHQWFILLNVQQTYSNVSKGTLWWEKYEMGVKNIFQYFCVCPQIICTELLNRHGKNGHFSMLLRSSEKLCVHLHRAWKFLGVNKTGKKILTGKQSFWERTPIFAKALTYFYFFSISYIFSQHHVALGAPYICAPLENFAFDGKKKFCEQMQSLSGERILASERKVSLSVHTTFAREQR